MMRTVRALLPFLLFPVLLTGCWTDKKSGAAGATTVSPKLDAAARAWGVAPELIYVTKVSGFTVIQYSVGAGENSDEFFAAYRSENGANFGLLVDRGTLTAKFCSEQPVGKSSERVTCERDGNVWYREEGVQRVYAVPGDGVVIRFTTLGDEVDRAILRKAAEAARRPDDAELAALLPGTNGADT